MIHHYGLVCFSLGTCSTPKEIWWRDEEVGGFWDVIAGYNVVALFTGHLHLTASDGNWQIAFERPKDLQTVQTRFARSSPARR